MKKLSILFLVSLLTIYLDGAEIVSAEIKNPYVVDEKPQVVFGDSVPVLTYFGLENYTQNYVGGYAHITFTYTHGDCCFAGYPPRLYITNVDPRTTVMPTVKASVVILHLQDRFHDPNHSTDWYSYDMQFDATGYTVVVKRAGVTEIVNEHREIPTLVNSDWVSLANLYPMFDPPVRFSMAFTPVPIRDEPTSERLDPVIIVPGIMGSAYKNGVLVIDPILHTYDDLITTLAANGYVDEEDLFTFPYEWRNSNIITAKLLRDKINDVQDICDCQKVDLVAHSMGGLVARQYIESDDYEGDVDQLIFLGTPHKGSAKSYLTWEAGEMDTNTSEQLAKQFFSWEAKRRGFDNLFEYIQNRPILSVQELLPTFDYLKDKDTGVVRTYPDNYPINDFLENLNDNVSNLLDSGIDIANFIGNSGNNTIEKIRIVPSSHSGLWEHGEPDGFYVEAGDNGLERGTGDDTVTLLGATLDDSIPNENSNASHRRLPTAEENKIFNILTGKTATTNIDNGFEISPIVLLLQLLSPIDFVITAPDGKKIGKNFETGGEYNEIPFAFYSGYQTEDEYITVLNPLDGEYKIKLQGTGNGGEYGVLTSYMSDGFTTTTEIIGITEPNQITELNVEVDNENPSDLVLERKVTLDVIIADINGAYDLNWITDKKVRDSLVKQVRLIVKFEKKRNGKYEKKVDKILLKLLNKELNLLLKKGNINQQAYNLLGVDLEYLISNN